MPLSSAQDHKRIFDDDLGPNTGGMGAFAPSPLVTADVERRVMRSKSSSRCSPACGTKERRIAASCTSG